VPCFPTFPFVPLVPVPFLPKIVYSRTCSRTCDCSGCFKHVTLADYKLYERFPLSTLWSSLLPLYYHRTIHYAVNHCSYSSEKFFWNLFSRCGNFMKFTNSLVVRIGFLLYCIVL